MKLRRWLALLSVCVLLCGLLPVGVSAAADKYPLKNGDFNNGSLTGWVAAHGVSVSTAAAREGKYGCLITGDGGWGDLLSQTFTVLPGYTYKLSFWYMAQPMGVSWYLSEGEHNVRLHRGWAGKKVWTKEEIEFTPTTDTVHLLFRASGSHMPEKVYLDSVTVELQPCTTHQYDNACDTICNVCDAVRQVGDHYYEYDCDIYCNHCGFAREASGQHTYAFPCATLCSYCDAPRVGEGEHTYSDVCDVTCDFCSEIREVPHFYDDIYDADCSHCGHVRIPVPKPMERLFAGGASVSPKGENVSNGAGLCFRFFLEATNCQIRPDRSYISKSALVERYNNGVQYKLICVGAVMSNEGSTTLDLEHLTARTIDVRAGYLCKVTEDSFSFAVRIVNIPEQGKNTRIQARPYYIYSDGKEEIVVYGDEVSQTFNGLYAAG